MKRNYTNIILASGLILMAAAARIINAEMHLYNLAPVAAVGLFSGAVIKDKRLSFILPLLAMFISDLYFKLFTDINGFYGIEQWFVYGGMALVTMLGTTMKNRNAARILGYSLAGSVVFFIVSNFGSFVGGMYGYGFNGLTQTYVMALPFFKNTIAGDLIGNVALFGLYALAQRAFTTNAQKA